MRAEDCARLLREQDRILLVTHRNPDGDTMGSAAALCSALRRSGKTAYLWPNPQVIAKLLPFVERFYAPADFVPSFVTAVDVAPVVIAVVAAIRAGNCTNPVKVYKD